jgi:hypothetical protein
VAFDGNTEPSTFPVPDYSEQSDHVRILENQFAASTELGHIAGQPGEKTWICNIAGINACTQLG